MNRFLSLFTLLGLALVLFYAWRAARLKNLARRRFENALFEAESVEPGAPEPRRAEPLLRRHLLSPWLAGGVAGAVLWLGFGLRGIYSATGALVLALLSWQVEALFAERRVQRVEVQLADAIDLMVGALRAGAGVMNALESAVRESRSPLHEQLDEMAGRIRFGDDPQAVFHSLPQRVPLETFLLFSSALSVNWEVGGSLASTLATVGRTVRDRIEISRRMRGMTTQVRISIIAVLGVTYFIAAVVWFNDPTRMQAFLATGMGSFFVAAAILLQAVGIVWASILSRSRT
jgi:tight adherence protein B